MLENAADSVKRYAPPSQRNRVFNRRKPGDRIERPNHSQGSDGDRNHNSYTKNCYSIDQGSSEKCFSGLISVDGCCTSDAACLLNERWFAAVNSYNDPATDLSEKPMMYSGASGSSWGHMKLPFQMDFLSELQRAIQNTGGAVSAPSAGVRLSS